MELIGGIKEAYFDLQPQDAKSYSKFKGEMLTRLKVTIALQAQRVPMGI